MVMGLTDTTKASQDLLIKAKTPSKSTIGSALGKLTMVLMQFIIGHTPGVFVILVGFEMPKDRRRGVHGMTPNGFWLLESFVVRPSRAERVRNMPCLVLLACMTVHDIPLFRPTGTPWQLNLMRTIPTFDSSLLPWNTLNSNQSALPFQ